ncbi:MAG: response regulator transcription factor [Propionibacteriaceae bacterium]|jgi:DNA-binding response OmpR family regulator|nr:response regulator transcription factor [Propionibacteriaceae bacterium]
MTILILEDDAALSKGIELALKSADRRFVRCPTVAAARAELSKRDPDLFLVDINLPDGSGLDFCARLRAAGRTAPILMLTANDTELDQVTGLESGADDYVTKPFSLAVLRARVDALLRRGHYAPVARVDGFLFDFEAQLFEKDGRLIELPKTEARLLRALFARPGRTLTRQQLSRQVWAEGAEYVDPNALSVAVRRLRGLLEDDPSRPRHIRTVHGVGYKWVSNL